MIWFILGVMTLAALLALGKLSLGTSPKRLRSAVRFASGAAWALGLVMTVSGKPLAGLSLLGLGAIGVGATTLSGKGRRSTRSEADRRGASSVGGPDVKRDPHRSRGSGNGLGGSGVLTEQEAYQILGLQPGAPPEEIIRSHRALMKKIHPDQGGATQVAARVNAARDLLMRARHR